MRPITRTYIIASMLFAFIVTVSISAFLASITRQNEAHYGAKASILTGITGDAPRTTPPQTTPVLCDNDAYGICPSYNACLRNPIGNYHCVHIPKAACPALSTCSPCSQIQLEQCIKNNPRTSSCVIAKNTSGSTTICSHGQQ